MPEAGEWTLYCTDGSDEALDKATISVQYEVVDKTLRYIVLDPILENNSWENISKGALKGAAPSYWSVGDRKTITIDTIGSFDVYILGFNHYGTTNTIDFGGFKQTSDGKDLCLYSYQMNTYGTNANGWKGSNMRCAILGSTKTKNADASDDTATNPLAGSLMAALPSDLRAVMKPMTIWTDNVGGGGDVASKVTTSIDYLPLLAEFEIFGSQKYANSYEQNHQKQYQYYANGNSKVKYQHNSTGSATDWWERSPFHLNANGFCRVAPDGAISAGDAAYRGVAPIFRV